MGLYLLVFLVQIVNAPTQLVTQQFMSQLECSNFARTLAADAKDNGWGMTVDWRCVPVAAYPSK